MQKNNDDQNNYSLEALSKNIAAETVKTISTFNKAMFLIIDFFYFFFFLRFGNRIINILRLQYLWTDI